MDELGLHRVQRVSVLLRGAELQLVVSHLLRPLQPLLDNPEAAPGPPLLPALPRHTRHRLAAQVPMSKAGNGLGHSTGCCSHFGRGDFMLTVGEIVAATIDSVQGHKSSMN